VEDFVSTRYLRGRYRALTGLEAEVSEVAAIAQCRENLPCKELEKSVELTPARRGSVARAAREVFDDFGRHLGLVLNQHAGEFKPEVIVLGGGIARASSLFLPATLKAMKFPARIVISALMDEAPLAGAGVHWFAARG
jgi:glucokinase